MAFCVESSVGRAEREFGQIEKTLNNYGHIFPVSILSGGFRAVMGIVQMVAFGVLSICAAFTGSSALSRRYSCTVLNGFANLFRGIVEMIPIAGNLLCYLYDSSGSSIQYIGERMDGEALLLRLCSNSELAISQNPNRSCFSNQVPPDSSDWTLEPLSIKL